MKQDAALLLACGAWACVAFCMMCLNVSGAGAFTNRKPPYPQQNPSCKPLEQQKSVDLQALAGYWYAVETIGHREDDKKRGDRYREVSSCPIMFLSQLDNSTDLRLRWEEPIGTVEYRFKVVDPSDPGFWWSVGQQNGSLAENEKYQYRHFAGTVQVMRAVSTDMVLTFCSPNSHHYSMVMSRTRNMTEATLSALNRLLTDRGLPLVTTLVACRGSSGAGAGPGAWAGAGAALGLVLLLALTAALPF